MLKWYWFSSHIPPWMISNLIPRDEWCESDKSFLFSLKSPSSEVGPTKMSIKPNMYSNAMLHNSYYGPTFGGSHDLHIANDANNNSNSESNLGHTYELPPGQTTTFLVGSNNFKVSDIEVFQIIWQYIFDVISLWCNTNSWDTVTRHNWGDRLKIDCKAFN